MKFLSIITIFILGIYAWLVYLLYANFRFPVIDGMVILAFPFMLLMDLIQRLYNRYIKNKQR